MTFVNEKISPEDYKKYGLGAIDGQYSATRSGDDSWTFDRERDIYLRHTQSFKDWRGPIIGMNFFWKGHLFDFELECIETRGKRNGPVWQHLRAWAFAVPSHLKAHEGAIKGDLRDAFLAQRESGLSSTSTSYGLNLEISDERAPK